MAPQKIALDALDRVIEAMQDATDEQTLCRACCNAITDSAGYLYSWIRFTDGSVIASENSLYAPPVESLEPLAHDSTGVSRLESRDGSKISLCPSISFALPIEGQIAATLTLCAAHPQLFSEEAACILKNLAKTTALAIRLIRRQQTGKTADSDKLRTLQLLNTISDTSSDAIFAKDMEGYYIFANREALRKTGKKLEDVIGKKDEEIGFFHPPQTANPYAQNGYTFEEEWTTVEGKRIFLTTSGTLKDSSGNIFGKFAISHDITERKRNEERLELALEAAGLDLWENNLITGQVTRKAHKVFAELGYDQDETTIDDMISLVHPDDRAGLLSALYRHTNRETAQYRCEFRMRTKSGLWIWYANYGKIMRHEGENQRFIGVTFNIDERRRREAELALREQASRTLIENSPDMIARYDHECRRIYVNPAFAAMTQNGAPTLLGKKPSESKSDELYSYYESQIRKVFISAADVQFELKWPNPEGCEICSHIRMTAERDTNGRVISVLMVARDITELNEYRAELVRNELAKTRFLAAAGHDLRQPVTAANMFIYALKSTTLTPHQGRLIQNLETSMSTFSGLLDTLLNLSKLDADRIKPAYTPIKVIDLLVWLEKNFAPMASGKQLRFKLYFPKNKMLRINSDLGLIKSVLINLVSNAIKFTPAGTILVSARTLNNQVLFQVRDSGIGILKENLEHIFDEFYQVNNPHRDRDNGLGLGLSIVSRTLHLLGSKIECKSQYGLGSIFQFQLPSDGQSLIAASQATSSDVEQHKNTDAAGKKFVVVENDKMVLQATSACLNQMGAKVRSFDNAQSALLHANSESADYYIVDYMLGGTLNGVELLGLLKEKLPHPVRAVLMTGDTSSNFMHTSKNLGWPVFFKPVNITELLNALYSQTSAEHKID